MQRAQRRIARLGEQQRSLAAREDALRARAAKLARASRGGPAWRWWGAARLERAQRRAELQAEGRRAAALREFDELLESLQAEAERTRRELDRALAPVERLREDWQALASTFALLDETIAAGELAPFLGQWHGALVVPEFPVHERAGHVEPFPTGAFVF